MLVDYLTIVPSFCYEFQVILITISTISLEQADNCASDYLEFVESGIVFERICGRRGSPFSLLTHTSAVEGIFHSNEALTDDGFTATFETVDSSGINCYSYYAYKKYQYLSEF